MLGGSGPKPASKLRNKALVLRIANERANLPNRLLRSSQEPVCLLHPYPGQIVLDGLARRCAEDSGKVGTVRVEGGSNVLDANGFGKIAVDESPRCIHQIELLAPVLLSFHNDVQELESESCELQSDRRRPGVKESKEMVDQELRFSCPCDAEDNRKLRQSRPACEFSRGWARKAYPMVPPRISVVRSVPVLLAGHKEKRGTRPDSCSPLVRADHASPSLNVVKKVVIASSAVPVTGPAALPAGVVDVQRKFRLIGSKAHH